MIFYLLFALLFASDDPNGFFKDRDWNLKVRKNVEVVARSKYQSEPVQKPNMLSANLKCGRNLVPILNKKYCGINYMKVIGSKLEIMYLDYSSKDSRGYCTKKRIERINLPKCPKGKNKKGA